MTSTIDMAETILAFAPIRFGCRGRSHKFLAAAAFPEALALAVAPDFDPVVLFLV